MWRCYGGLGESYAIGLDPSVSLQILCNADAPSPFGERRIIRCRPWTPVRYGPQEHRALAEAVFEGLSDDLAALRARVEREGQMDQAAIVEELAETLDDVEQALVLAKHEGFSDEREVRHTVSLLTDPGSPGWPGLVRYRATPYGIAPYLWLTGHDGTDALTTTRRARLPIRAVAVSPSANGPAAELSLSELLAAHGYAVDVRRWTIPFRG